MKMLFVVHSSNLVYGAAKSISYVLKNTEYEYDVVFSNILRFKCPKKVIKEFVGEKCKNIFYLNLPYESSIVLGLESNNFTIKNILRKIGLKIQKVIFYMFKYQINKIFEEGKYDVIHLNCLVLYPLISNKHCFVLHVRELYNNKDKIKLYSKLSMLSGIIYIDNSVRSSLNYKLENEITLNNPFDMINVKNINKNKILSKYNLTDNDVIFSIIGTIVELKGVDFVIDSLINSSIDEIKVLVVGNNKSKYAKKCIESSKNDSRILFIDETLNIMEIYSIVDYVIRADLEFCVGRTVYEALYSGCGVIIQGSFNEISKMSEYNIFKDKIHYYKARNSLSFVEKIKELSKIKVKNRNYYSNVDEYIKMFDSFLSKVKTSN